ncbi:hypothetical protein AUEXF2481DRAFT_2751 [Aureobasidium subglaciale EXF-2481]|uniref:Uncharacterized protein n=1 Tax=Aureobasidium subglaciale (strain EXF-2481) TaxID=1043005 RepID=A0A074YJ45_AURSE|nr:uncharacterized protein AUEXF2481DRAFT_2751 [Aureobasidium subglaciale EXF-2481]KAI5197398.1 hypothetical protein E4T38_07990 [Aureobasidium subglaciale]KAI5216324.1 hypothetical protein E4T40_08000 [Aureobasidium subglaciale]KAI5219554.1 hypothetical protein E4T41_07915 [Aureobasidium subglaciale]KAI5257598.1 hypothetical protein E4T46_07891 [Aureobasidium subglaciale]KEQ97828.1 hypothetical protein AUEXF2481DRAFT_2751 [Aureobasidium subglaciale EXF-2481]
MNPVNHPFGSGSNRYQTSSAPSHSTRAETSSSTSSLMHSAHATKSNSGSTASPASASDKPTPAMISTRPLLGDMVVSINRQKMFSDDSEWTAQFLLKELGRTPSGSLSIDQLLYACLCGEVDDKLRCNIETAGITLVWILSGTDQLGVIRNDSSLKAAVVDHQNHGKYTMHLYVVKLRDDNVVLPEAQVTSSRTFNLPKLSALNNQSILSPDPGDQDNTPKPGFTSTFSHQSR